jgi:hypothetical protein
MVPKPPPPARNIDMDSFIETALRRNWRHGNGLCRADAMISSKPHQSPLLL